MKKDRSVEIVFKRTLTTIIDFVQRKCIVFAQLLEAEKIITRRTYDTICAHGLSPYEQASKLVEDARVKLEFYPRYFEKFTTCLEEIDEDLARDVLQLYKDTRQQIERSDPQPDIQSQEIASERVSFTSKWKELLDRLKSGKGIEEQYVIDCSTSNWLQKMMEIIEKESQFSSLAMMRASGLRLWQCRCIQHVIMQHSYLRDDGMFLIVLLAIFYKVPEVMKCLLTISSRDNHHTLVEFLCCISVLFYQLWKKNILPYRCYHVALSCHCLLLSPNSVSLGEIYTEEQKAIIEHSLRPGEQVLVKAFAGCGKTHTLHGLVKKNPTIQFLYLCFNNAMQKQAKERFKGSSNIVCQTFHSVAHKIRQELDLAFRRGNLSPNEIAECAKCSMQEADHVAKTLENFFTSDNNGISLRHVPWETPRRKKSEIREMAETVWQNMSASVAPAAVRLNDNGILKLFQLKNPAIPDCDCILIDGAEDITPVMKAVLENEENRKLHQVWVGDPYQDIYDFRARNANNIFAERKPMYRLTQSFRFGPSTAYIASLMLISLGEKRDAIVVRSLQEPGEGGYYAEEEDSVAIIARTNLTLFKEVKNFCEKDSESKIAFAGGIESYEYDTILDMYCLKEGMDINEDSIEISGVNSWDALETQARNGKNSQLKWKLEVCQTFERDEVEQCIRRAKEQSELQGMSPKVTFSTVYKCKGLEFDRVQLCDDFGTHHSKLLYMAVTRARKYLVLSPLLVDMLSEAKEHFFQPMLLKETKTCHDDTCGKSLPSQSVCIRRKEYGVYTEFEVQKAGEYFLCGNCSVKKMRHINDLLS